MVAPLLVVDLVHDAADGQAQELVDGAHPGGVALGKVVVHGDDVDAAPGERIEIDGQGRDQRLALAGLHLGDAALVQHHAADELHVEMTLAERTFGRLANGGECFGDQIVEIGAFTHAGAVFFGARAQGLIGERGSLGLQRVDLVDDRAVVLEFTVVG